MHEEKPVILTLNHYQAANLRWLLRIAWECPHDKYPALNTGDWASEIPQMLEQEMIECDVTVKPNVDDEFARKPIEGTCTGVKRSDYESAKRKAALDRVLEIAALKHTPDDVKLSLIEQAAKGWWGLPHAKAIKGG